MSEKEVAVKWREAGEARAMSGEDERGGRERRNAEGRTREKWQKMGRRSEERRRERVKEKIER